MGCHSETSDAGRGGDLEKEKKKHATASGGLVSPHLVQQVVDVAQGLALPRGVLTRGNKSLDASAERVLGPLCKRIETKGGSDERGENSRTSWSEMILDSDWTSLFDDLRQVGSRVVHSAWQHFE